MAIDTDAVLSFSAPAKARLRIEAAPSAAFELVQVLLRLSLPESKTRHLDFIHDLQQRRPELARRITKRREDAEGAHWSDTILVLLLLAAHGYARSADAQPFLDNLPALLSRAKPLFKEELEHDLERSDHQARREAEPVGKAILACLERLHEDAQLEPYVELLQAVWEELRPVWQEQGLAHISAECVRINQALAEGRGLLEVLPEHSYLKAEAYQGKLEDYAREGGPHRILLTPLYFISGGGHHFNVGAELFVGFGLEEERVRSKKRAFAQDLAGRMKAFSDPSRVMILSLICDFSSKLTVSDLALQFGLTQPTVSGHLKLLKEAGLVSVMKEGTKAFYSADPDAIEALLGDFKDFVMPWRYKR